MSEAEPSKHWALPVLSLTRNGWEARSTALRLQSRIERRIVARLEAHGLTLPQFDVLTTLWNVEGINQQELAERLLVTKGNVVGIIDRVSAAGWLERRADPTDRRANLLYLTDAGRNLIERIMPGEFAFWKSVFSRFSEGEIHLMYELLERLENAVKECE